MNPKWILASKTFLLNAAAVALEGIQWYSGVHYVDPQVLAIVVGVLNIVIRRWGTSQPVTFAKP